MPLVHRTDVGARLRADHKTPQGHARLKAAFSRTGVQNYPQPDGTVRREYRSPDEVFAPASLATFDSATVVEGHPAMIDPSNWREHAVGDVKSARRDGNVTAGEIIIRDKSTIAKVDTGELQEISLGYTCDLVFDAGVSPEGEKYDAVQREIRVNHVGLGPAGWGRAGSNVRLRLDGGEVAYLEDESPRPRPLGMTPEEIEALKTQAAKDKARADAAEARLAGLQTPAAPPAPPPPARPEPTLDALLGQRDEAIEKARKLEERVSATNIDSLVQARFTVLDGARVLHGKSDIPTTGTDRQIMLAAIKARDPHFDETGRSDDYIRSRFDAKVEDAKKVTGAMIDLARGTAPNAFQAPTLDAAGDPMLADLIRQYDAALEYPELYVHADPWRYGETAAHNAVMAAMAGKKG